MPNKDTEPGDTIIAHTLQANKTSVDDITSLPAHHAYVRVTSEGMRIPTFTMRLRHPQDGYSDMSKKVRSQCGYYTKTAEEIDKLMADEAYEEMLLAEEQSGSDEATFEDHRVSFEDIVSRTISRRELLRAVPERRDVGTPGITRTTSRRAV